MFCLSKAQLRKDYVTLAKWMKAASHRISCAVGFVYNKSWTTVIWYINIWWLIWPILLLHCIRIRTTFMLNISCACVGKG